MSKLDHDYGSDLAGGHHIHVPYWKRAHSDWRFWVGVVLMFVANITYVMSLDLRWRPRDQQRPSPSTAAHM